MIAWMTRDLAERGMTEPWHHGTSRPPIIESEATNRVLALSELMDCPVLFVHVSTPDAFKVIREAQTRLMSVYAETCPHYLLLTAQEMKAPGFEGATLPRAIFAASLTRSLQVPRHAALRPCARTPKTGNAFGRTRSMAP